MGWVVRRLWVVLGQYFWIVVRALVVAAALLWIVLRTRLMAWPLPWVEAGLWPSIVAAELLPQSCLVLRNSNLPRSRRDR